MGRSELDLEDFGITHVELLLDRIDKVRRSFPNGDITIVVEIYIKYDREAVEKARKEPRTTTAAATATTTPTPTPQPPLTAPSESGSRIRGPVISEDLRGRLDGS
jgi:hypothetical protein